MLGFEASNTEKKDLQYYIDATKHFMDSKLFIVILAITTFLFYVGNIFYIPYYIVLLLLIVGMLVKCDFTFGPAIPIMFFASFHSLDLQVGTPWFVILMIEAVITLFTFLWVIYRKKDEVFSMFKIDGINYSMIAIFIIMFISMKNAPDIGLSWSGVMMWTFIYLFYFAGRILVPNTDDSRKKIVFCMMIFMILISAELLYSMLMGMADGKTFAQLSGGKQITKYLGYMHMNQVMTLVNMGILMALYYFIRYRRLSKRIFSMLTVSLGVLMNVLFPCRGGYLGLLVVLPICVVLYFLYWKKYKYVQIKQDAGYLWAIGIIFLMGICILLLQGSAQKILSHIQEIGGDDNGRDKLINLGIEVFKQDIWFGSGVYSCSYYVVNVLHWKNGSTSYHCYIFDILSQIGIVGAIAFIAFLCFSVKRCAKGDLYSLFVLVLISYFLIHGIVDFIFFSPYVMPVLTMFMALAGDKDDLKVIELGGIM